MPRPSWCHPAGFSVDGPGRTDDAPAEGFANGLVAEADAENRQPSRPSSRMAARETPAPLGSPGPGEMTMPLIAAAGNFVHRDLIIAAHHGLGSQLAQKLHQVVGE